MPVSISMSWMSLRRQSVPLIRYSERPSRNTRRVMATSLKSTFSGSFAIGHRQGDFRHAERLALFGAVENDVRHFAAAQGLGGGFAEHPADGIDHVGLAAAVRADDAGHAFGEFKHGLVRERLEAVDFESFEIHADRSWLRVKPEREVGCQDTTLILGRGNPRSANHTIYGAKIRQETPHAVFWRI